MCVYVYIYIFQANLLFSFAVVYMQALATLGSAKYLFSHALV